ncbi:hypothetical protein WR25_07021 isoform B [Diploscapter pachys]|uniref:TPM domain-containing protein n=1 Tax=Diploscapter pachys TaxID=2018661 RepID=A0A2A2JRS0_9BILA|nr:hypothetical protein WR25_07021 isoform A [Diploscapter pachys]PAV64434.1 hypothetical protein WR25_07021 isoform B [Diploscapter pachys]
MLLFLLFGFSISIQAFDRYTPETYPDSSLQPLSCGQPRPSFLCDPNDFLSRTNNTGRVDKLSTSLIEVRGKTKCSCSAADEIQCIDSSNGFTMSIALVPKFKLNDDEYTQANLLRAAELFADSLRDRYDRDQCDDDILIVYSTNDSIIWTSVGDVASRYLYRTVIDQVQKQAGKSPFFSLVNLIV